MTRGKRRIVLLAACLALILAGPMALRGAAARSGAGQDAARQDAPGQRDSKRDAADAKRKRPGQDPGVMLERANRFVMQGRCDEAIPMLERLLAEYPQIAAASGMLAECYLGEGRPREAVALLEKCLVAEPENFECLRSLGRAYIEGGEKEKGVAVWRRILTIGEENASLYGTVAKMEQEAGLYDEAIATLREGTRFKDYGEHYAREIIRLERILGRDEEAFRDAILLVGRHPGSLEAELRAVADIFRESRERDRLVAVADSLAAAGRDTSGAFRTLRAVFLAETGRYGEVREMVFGGARSEKGGTDRSRSPGTGSARPEGKARPGFGEEELNALINYMAISPRKRDDPDFKALHEETMRAFLERHGSSPRAPGVMLMLAAGKRETARSAGPDRPRLIEEALALADEAKGHRFGAPFVERAAIFKARVRFEDLRAPEEALAELDGARIRSPGASAEAADLRVRILLASRDRGEAEKGLRQMAGVVDSTTAITGAYGLGKLAFLSGKYQEALTTLSDLAEKHPSSAYANDALELAIEIKEALPEGGGSLGLYRAAVLASERGEAAAAVDSLAALEGSYPASSLVPRSIFMRAELEAAWSIARARADYERLAERFPLHDLAPRSLERLAALAEQKSSAEAITRYGELMERYPDYPFMERVRERYVALGTSGDAAGEEASPPGKGAGEKAGPAGEGASTPGNSTGAKTREKGSR